MRACLMKVNYDPKYTNPNANKSSSYMLERLDATKRIYTRNTSDKSTSQSTALKTNGHHHLTDSNKSPQKPGLNEAGKVIAAPRGKPSVSQNAGKSEPVQTYPKSVPQPSDKTEPMGAIITTESATSRTDPVTKCAHGTDSVGETKPASAPPCGNSYPQGGGANTLEPLLQSSSRPVPLLSQCTAKSDQTSGQTNVVSSLTNSAGPASDSNNQPKLHARLTERHKMGVAKAHSSVRLQRLSDVGDVSTRSVSILQPRNNGVLYEGKASRHLIQSSFSTFSNRRLHNNGARYPEDKEQVNPFRPNRSRTVVSPVWNRVKHRSMAMIELEKKARISVERAIKEKKIFTIQGPYHSLRRSLRKRGWVEKFTNAPSPSDVPIKPKPLAKIPDSQGEGGESDEQNGASPQKISLRVPPWEEKNGFYGMMSYLLRDCTPSFVFTVKSSQATNRHAKSGQLVNHFGKARHFTTKNGLSHSIKSVPWYEDIDPDTFYPRCYRVDEHDEKRDFVDDYRLTSCIGLVKRFVQKYESLTEANDVAAEGYASKQLPVVSSVAVTTAVRQCERFIRFKTHQDIDDEGELDTLTNSEWQQFLQWYYLFAHEYCDLSPVTPAMVSDCQELLRRLEPHCPQFLMDGYRNVWIIKPGAKSRGRGIQCLDSLENIEAAIFGSDCPLVVQKYIERPLLVYNTKFDIRQWFLVTEWNPLTIWFYKQCYLRFCSKEFSLEEFDPAIHLSNAAIQKHFRCGPRSGKLPEDNMWTCREFRDHLSDEAPELEPLWASRAVPGMKKAIISSLVCTQDLIEPRKGGFEMYGADFMLTADMNPWLLEINSSPSMAQTTHATAPLVDSAFDDMLKVVLDYRQNKKSETGQFEMLYKQPTVSDLAHTVEGNFCVQGITLNRPHRPRSQGGAANSLQAEVAVSGEQRPQASDVDSSGGTARSSIKSRQSGISGAVT